MASGEEKQVFFKGEAHGSRYVLVDGPTYKLESMGYKKTRKI